VRVVLRRLGALGAVLALSLQLLLPFLAMPQAANAQDMAQDMAMLDQAATVWGSGSVCEPGAATSHDGKQSPMAGHQCPICWAMQQAASLLPPSAPPEPAPLVIAWVTASALDRDAFRPLALSPAQPRGPPSV
jgi:hypothetical protein